MPALRLRSLPLVLLLIAFALPARAQDYFGRNKVRYEALNFRVLKTEHFDVYYYDEEKSAATEAARMAERWYSRLSTALDHTLSKRQPLLLYASHPQFEQTNAVEGDLSDGVGGVTESFKRRIVLPLAGPLAETDHVIGHELTHAFQYDIMGQGGPRIGSGEIQAPLWFLEGMAEYLSIGGEDANTAMWMRDAAIQNKLPNFSKLDDPRYFPYRYGQAFWAYIADRYGEDAVGRLLKAQSRGTDPRRSISAALGINADTLVLGWHQAIRDWNAPIAAATQPVAQQAAPLILDKRGGGRLNVSPALSPDGTRLVFLSEKSQFSVEMYLADATSGKILRQITRTATDPHFQSLEFISSAGDFSPDGRRFAFAGVSRGRPVLTVMDVHTGRIVKEHRFPEIGEIFSPTWSPDGQRVVFSALVEGLTDLWEYDLASGRSKRLTNDRWGDLQPAWSPDGKSIAFVTDRFDGKDGDPGPYRLALFDVDTGEIKPVAAFPNARHTNPQWSPDGADLYFVSDRGGIANLYRVSVAGGEPKQITNLQIGVSGITPLSPAMSVARTSGRLVFSAYEKGAFDLYRIDPGATLAGTALHELPGDPARLPPGGSVATASAPSSPAASGAVPTPPSSGALAARPVTVDTTAFRRTRYHAGLTPDYVGQVSLGVAGGSSGFGAAGGAALYWSDMLGNNRLATLLQFTNAGGSFVNNTAAAVGYTNMANRYDWGLELSQIPYISTSFIEDQGTVNGNPAIRDREFRYWQIDRSLEAGLSYPFSRFQRVEFSGGLRTIDFESEVETSIFNPDGTEISHDTQKLIAPPNINLGTAGTALVYDNSVFAGTSPIMGQRWRLGVTSVNGTLNLQEVTADFRRYQSLGRPFSLAGRVLHYGRYGSDSDDDRLAPLFLGYPSLVRGYDQSSFTLDEGPTAPGDTTFPVFDRLLGTRLGVANVELRMGLLGPFGLAPSAGLPPAEIAAFFDAGTAWTSSNRADWLGGDRKTVTSHGLALRLNLFGFAVAEVDLVHPNNRPQKNWLWQFALQPGF